MKPVKTQDKLDKRQKNYLKKRFGISAYRDLTPTVLKNLKEEMKSLTDPRVQSKCTYKIWDIVIYVIISVLCGKKDWEEIHDFIEAKYGFFKSFLKMTGGIPSAKTIERVMAIIDYKELEKILVQFFKSITKNILSDLDILNIDGRVNNGSKRKQTFKQEEVSPLNMLNVYSNKYGICIASQIIEDKTNEIPNVKTIVESLNLQNSIVTWDALNTQKENVEAVINSKGSYVVPIKANHPLFYEELQDFFSDKELEYIKAGKLNTEYKTSVEYKNGCTIKYEYFQTTEVNWFEEKELWKNLRTFGIVKKTIETLEKTSIECRYYISNLDIDIELFSTSIRKHWSVENKLHWHLDVTFKLDKNTTTDKMALANLEIINKFVLGIVKRVQSYYKISLKRIIGKLGDNVEEYFLELIALLVLADGESKGEV